MALELAVVLVGLIALAGGQFLPTNSCPGYFRFVNDAFEGLQGEITLPPLKQGRNRIDLSFSQQGEHSGSTVGPVNPYPDETALRSRTEPSRFRISLRQTDRLPKLTWLSYNDQVLCSDREYDPPNSYYNRFYELHISGPVAPLPSLVATPSPRNNLDVDVQTVYFPSTRRNSFTQTWQTSSNREPFVRPQLITPAQTPTDIFFESPVPSIPVTVRPSFTTSQNTPPPPLPTQSPRTVANPPPTQIFNPRSPSSEVVCGIEGSLVPYIVKGTEFPRGMYPWLSAIFHKAYRSLTFKCGGSLISASIVITAAHCVDQVTKEQVVIGLGRYDLDNYGEDGAETRNVLRMVKHPDYNTRMYSDADIALITIERPVTFNDIIAPICMWTVEASTTVSTVGFVAGWGVDGRNSSPTQYPRVVEAEIVSPTVCASSWRGQKVPERGMCAGNLDGSGPCVGDSGGGLMVKQGNKWLLRGIVSTGERAADNSCALNHYVLYCDLSKHINWISSNIQ